MITENKTYKMGINWAKRFVDQKKENAGWAINDIENDNQVISTPEGRVFAIFETKTGLVHTKSRQ